MGGSTSVRIVFSDSRELSSVSDNSVALIVTSPPYWNVKDYGVSGQIGHGQTLHGYLKSLYLTWSESYRVLEPGGRLCINVGDQFLRKVTYGRYRIVPLHAEFIVQCDRIGFDYLGSIIWQKKTTMRTTGGAPIMGSYPYPPNGMVEIDYEFILIFKKEGKRRASKEVKEASRLSLDEWKQYFSGHWIFPGERQKGHDAMFPEELPRRLIKMFSYRGDTVLDPFLGSGTTASAAIELQRNFIGFELNRDYRPLIEDKINRKRLLTGMDCKVEFIENGTPVRKFPDIVYSPAVRDLLPPQIAENRAPRKRDLYRVKEIIDSSTIRLENGWRVTFHGIEVREESNSMALDYLNRYVRGKKVYLEFADDGDTSEDTVSCYVFLENRIFVNREMVKSGLANVASGSFKHRESFVKTWRNRSR